MFPHTLSLFLWIVHCNFTQQAMEFQKDVFGWLEEATLFPANQQGVSQQHDLNFDEVTFPENGKAKDHDPTLFDIPNVCDILDDNDWMDEKIDLSILDSNFQDCLGPPSSSLKLDVLDVATEIDSLVDNYFQSNSLLPLQTTLLSQPINDIQSSPSTSTYVPISEAAASSPASILPEIRLQLPSSPVEYAWSESSSLVGTSQLSDGDPSDVSEVTNNSERDIDSSPFAAYYIDISYATIESDSQQAATPKILIKRAGSSISKTAKVSVKPYSLAPHQLKKESRRERKKVQNKEAAARYRTKKREQDKVVGDEVATLENEQKSLQEKHDSLKTEIKYLKSLMREMFKARGLLK